MKHKLLLLLICSLLTQVTHAYVESCSGICGSGLEWRIPDDTECRLQIEGTGSMFNYTLDRIPTYQYCCDITAVSLPNGLVNIGDFAFANITSCKEIILPATVKFIGKGAFMNSTNLYVNRIWSPNIISVGDSAFYGCKHIGSISGLIKDTVRNATFYGTGATLSSIPSHVRYIGDYAFAGCDVGSTLTIPDNVTHIGDSAFANCSNLTTIILNSDEIALNAIYPDFQFPFGNQVTEFIFGDNVTWVGRYALSGNSTLEKISIGKNVTQVDGEAFKGCSSLREVEWNAIRTADPDWGIASTRPFSGNENTISTVSFGNNVQHIPEALLYGFSKIKSINIPNSVRSIGSYAFSGCSNLTSVTIGENVTSIEEYAFWGCSNLPVSNHIRYADTYIVGVVDKTLTEYTIKTGTKWIGESAFYGCTKLAFIDIPSSVISIGSLAYYECTTLSSLVIPNSVEKIGRNAFSCCSNLNSIDVESGNDVYDSRNDCNAIIETSTNRLIAGCKNSIIPNSVTSIGEEAFKHCKGLSFIEMPENVTSIGSEAFANCYNLTSVTLPNSIKDIEFGAFMSCYRLKTINFPSNIRTIGGMALNGCSGLRSIICAASVPPVISENVLGGVNLSSCTLYVPAKSIDLYMKADGWKAFKNIRPLEAEEANVLEPTAEPTSNSVVVEWPKNDNAETYTIVIEKGNETICTFEFDVQGQLINIAYAAPARNGIQGKTRTAKETSTGWQYSISGLDANTEYTYTVTARKSDNSVVYEQSVPFKTQNAATNIDTTYQGSEPNVTKILHNGQILILRGEKMYTIQGQEVNP
ncbi:MAG: leucine-rich repeat domain-containing protein [Paludibacteraceae bacterium]|nr:leucine-rich repeat domain-containing protein [Paludibacteraceae bacterium]